MKVGIMQPYFFPYIGYWQLINAVDTFVIYDDVNYIKGGWINRNNILVSGSPKFINLRLSAASSNKLINEIIMSNDTVYKKKLLKTIKESYSHAPFIQDIYPLLENIINSDENSLSKLLIKSIKITNNYLNIDTDIIISSNINKINRLKSHDKIIDICKSLDADEYINAIGGQSLYSKKDFLNENIDLKFLKTKEIRYKQFDFEKFIPNLSIMDVMMFNSPEQIKEMLNQYELL